MRIRAKASPSFVFEAHPDAAKELIEGGIYEEAKNEPTPSIPTSNSTQPEVKKPKGRRRKA